MRRSRMITIGVLVLGPIVVACTSEGSAFTAGRAAASASQLQDPSPFAGSPYLGVLYNSVVEGEIWERPELSKRDRSLITVAVLQALDLDQLSEEIIRGLDHGLTAEGISETILQTAFYAGFPTGKKASGVAGAVFQGRGISLAPIEGSWVPPNVQPQARTSGGYAAVSRLGELRDVLLYGDVWERPGLSKRDRSMVTVAVLQALNRSELAGHQGRAMDNGVTAQELREIVLHVTFYGGWPQAVTAGGMLAELFEQRGIPLQ